MKTINRSVFNGIAGKLGPKPAGVVWHNDAGSKSAESYASWLSRHSPEVGFAHYYIDRHTVFRAEDTFNKAWHCGDSWNANGGNNCFVGYETVESMSASDADFIQNELATARQIAEDMKYWGMKPTPNTVKLHREFTPTACPHRTFALHGNSDAAVKGWMCATILKFMNGAAITPPKSQPHINQGNSDKSNYGASYRTHLPKQGWLGYVSNGVVAGTTGKGIGIEAIELFVDGKREIKAKSHIQDIGWKETGNAIGTIGKGKCLEAFSLKLTGATSEKWTIEYQAHVANQGWEKTWHKEGEVSGTTGKSHAIEAVRFRLIQKSIKQGHSLLGRGLEYRTHIAHQGNLGYVSAGEVSGTTGKAIQVEQLEILFDGSKDDINVQGHVAQIGWQPYQKGVAGTTGKGLQLEAVRIRLTGELAKRYKIEYQAHVQNKGWMKPVYNGEVAGTVGRGLRIEAIKIKLIEK